MERAQQRRRPQDLQSVNCVFNPDEFNFNKVPLNEILMKPKEVDSSSQDNVIIINVSPLEFGNSLLVPSVTQNIPQMVTLEGFELLVKVMLLSTSDRYFV